ncbi:MAG: hypothetical protein LPK85_04885 [Gammaproteobacteria bacterium]|nr:hypothetical protein [Gammaproteobacteria bacterium]
MADDRVKFHTLAGARAEYRALQDEIVGIEREMEALVKEFRKRVPSAPVRPAMHRGAKTVAGTTCAVRWILAGRWSKRYDVLPAYVECLEGVPAPIIEECKEYAMRVELLNVQRKIRVRMLNCIEDYIERVVPILDMTLSAGAGAGPAAGPSN